MVPVDDPEAAFQRAFKAAGGEIVGSVRFPVANPDFSAFVRAKDAAPECIYIFIPGGVPAALGKAFAERGIDVNKTKVLGSGETTAEQALKVMGDAGLGISYRALRLQGHVAAQRRVRQGLQRDARAQSRLLLGRGYDACMPSTRR